MKTFYRRNQSLRVTAFINYVILGTHSQTRNTIVTNILTNNPPITFFHHKYRL